MAGHSVSVRRELLAEPPVVWAIVTDIDRANKTLTAVEKVERVSGTGFDVGTKWRETRRMLGRLETEDMEVLESQPPNRAVIGSESNGTSYRTEIELLPSSLGTTLIFTFHAEPGKAGMGQKMMFAVLGNAGVKAAKASLEQDLADIGNVIERRMRK